jgi:hypothetical protein
MKFYTPDDDSITYATLLLMGAPKSGKTLTASTATAPYFLDIERGAASTGCARAEFTFDKAGYKQLERELATLAKLTPEKDGLLKHKVNGHQFQIGTVVLDSMDALQQMADQVVGNVGDQRAYWGEMLKLMRGIVTTLRKINAHVIMIAHSRPRSLPVAKGAPERFDVGLALQGQIAIQVPRWADVILHLANLQTGAVCFTKTETVDGRTYLAGDRHNLFGGNRVPIVWKDNKPLADTMATILARASGGVKIVAPVVVREESPPTQPKAFDPAGIRSFEVLYQEAQARLGFPDVQAVKDTLAAYVAERLKGERDKLRVDPENAESPFDSAKCWVALERMIAGADGPDSSAAELAEEEAPQGEPSGDDMMEQIEVQATELLDEMDDLPF